MELEIFLIQKNLGDNTPQWIVDNCVKLLDDYKFAVIDEYKKSIEIYSKEEKENLECALLEAIYISHWTENKQALYAVLEPEEAEKIVKDIFIELDKNNFEITRKIK